MYGGTSDLEFSLHGKVTDSLTLAKLIILPPLKLTSLYADRKVNIPSQLINHM